MSEEELKAIERLDRLTIGSIIQTTDIENASTIMYDKIILLNLINKQQKEIENKDKKLKDIESHIKTELMMIEKCYNEVNLFSRQQYDGMMASYKCLLNIFFSEIENEK